MSIRALAPILLGLLLAFAVSPALAPSTATASQGAPEGADATPERADADAEAERAPAATSAATKPHILVILADDLGWRDVGYHGSEIETPTIDRLARAGQELDHFYVQPTCSPTRAALMTGMSPLRVGITRPISKNEALGLPLDLEILPQYLNRFGYQSQMVGKWHLGHVDPRYFPHNRGFEHFYGHVTGGIGYWDHTHGGGYDWQINGETFREDGYSTRLMADHAIHLVETRDPDRPHFLYLAFNAPHLPNEAPPETIALYEGIENPNRRIHAAMVHELDNAIARVIDAYQRAGMLENTIVFFSSDNGGLNEASAPPALVRAARWLSDVFGRPIPVEGLEFLVSNALDGGSDNTPLPGGKGSVAEGGIRVPASFWWPGRAEGKSFTAPMTIQDVLPTLLDAIGEGEAIPDTLDGRSFWPTLRDGTWPEEIPDYVTQGMDGLSVHRPPWKLVIPSSPLPWAKAEPPRLYQLWRNPRETHDFAEGEPELVEELLQLAEDWPRGPSVHGSTLGIVIDPDRFGGPEDRAPWADRAKEQAPPGALESD